MSYRIYELSARAVTCYARETDGVYTYHLSRAATEWCRVLGARHEQDGNALFFQTMCVIRGEDYQEESGQLIEALADVIFYMDFSGIFDRRATPKHLDRQRKAEDMFRPASVNRPVPPGHHGGTTTAAAGSVDVITMEDDGTEFKA